VNGNESSFSLVTPSGTTDVGDSSPLTFALFGVTPNPAFGARMMVAFALPGAAPARLELLDVGGRRVSSAEVGALGAGRHVVELPGGHTVGPGVFFLSLTQAGNQRVTRIIVLR
jgi:hypothetical protein